MRILEPKTFIHQNLCVYPGVPLTRIAFAFGNTTAWQGGLSFYDNLLTAISLADGASKNTLIAVIPNGDTRFDSLIRRFDEVHLLPAVDLLQRVVRYIAPSISARESMAWLTPESSLSRMLRKVKADVSFLKEDPLANFRVPNICWFPDFQYLHMPEMFTLKEIQVYDRVARNTARFANRVMLSSHAAQNDFARILPGFVHKTKVIPFTAWIDDNIYQDDASLIAQEYHLPLKFFYLPNQFWKHKNHKIILRALSLLRNEGEKIIVVASGKLEDYRNPSYPSEIIAEIKRSKLEEQFIFLGVIPRSHVYSLMRQSLGVIQPSFFEGWSTSIEEAKSLGKPALVSNLDVHKEQDLPGAIYFNPHNVDELAGYMKELHKEWSPGSDYQAENRAHEWMYARAKDFGESFLDLTFEAMQV